MKCEHCNNEMVWVGSLQSGRMTCNHCALTEIGEAYHARMAEQVYAQEARVRKGVTVVTVGGGGGGSGGGAASSGCASPPTEKDYEYYDI